MKYTAILLIGVVWSVHPPLINGLTMKWTQYSDRELLTTYPPNLPNSKQQFLRTILKCTKYYFSRGTCKTNTTLLSLSCRPYCR